MFGNDFKRFDKNEEEGFNKKPQPETNEIPIINKISETNENMSSKKKDRTYNYTIKALLYFLEDEYMNRFLHQFSDLGKFDKSFVNIQPEPVGIFGLYQNYKICISLMMVKDLKRLEQFREIYMKGAYAVMIYFNPHEEDFITKITNLIENNRPFSEGKFIVVVEKEELNPELESKIKNLQDQNLIQGIYQFSQEETNNDNRFITETMEIIELTKIIEK